MVANLNFAVSNERCCFILGAKMIQVVLQWSNKSCREWTKTHGFLRNSKNPSLHAVDNFLPSFLLSKKKVAVQGYEVADSET